MAYHLTFIKNIFLSLICSHFKPKSSPMKTITIFLGILLTISSCVDDKPTSLDQTQKDLITKEIVASIDQIINGWNTKNIETAFPLFLNSPDFTFMGMDGEMTGYQAIIDMSKSMFDTMESCKYTLLDKKIKIIDQNSVVALINNNAEIKYLDGTIQRFPKIGCTFVFSKINDKWMVTHFQESTLSPETIAPEKK